MAKQTSLIKINGKADGQSFYTSKNGGALMRSINKGMSARVKDSKEYANTRKNNAEFGMCGDFAGAIIKPISLRWRFILDSIATGKMVKVLKDLLRFDTISVWGQRVINAASNADIVTAFNGFSKNEMLDEISQTLADGVSYNAGTGKIVLSHTPTLSADRQRELIDMGINHVNVKVFALSVIKPAFDAAANAYDKAVSTLSALSLMDKSVDLAGSAPVDLFGTSEVVFDAADLVAGTKFGGLLVVYLPCRSINGNISVLQESCAAQLSVITAAA